MRKALAVGLLMACAAVGFAQLPEPPEPRYGVKANPDLYPQATPREALASVAKAAESKRYDYLVAHLLDPAVVDVRVADRARQIEGDVEKELAATRADQRKNPQNYTRDERLPLEPGPFAERVKAEAERRAFRLLAQDVQDTLGEFPENVKQLRAIARDEKAVTEAGGTATAATAGVPGKTVFLKLAGKRWVMEDRQQDDAKPKAEK